MEFGTVSPNDFAVFRLITSSNLSACSAGLRTLEHLVHESGNLDIGAGQARAVGHQPPGLGVLAIAVDRRQALARIAASSVRRDRKNGL
jgi:hypothetical protein